MRKINPSLQFLLPKKPFLQGHTSVNAVSGTLMAARKEVWSTLFSWVFRIFFCSLEACRHDHNNIKRNYYFTLSKILVTRAMEQLFSEVFCLASQPNSLPRSLCLHILGNLVVSFSLCTCKMKHKCSYLLNDFLINSNCLVTFSSHNMQLQAEETIVTALWVKSLPSSKPMRAGNPTYFQSPKKEKKIPNDMIFL